MKKWFKRNRKQIFTLVLVCMIAFATCLSVSAASYQESDVIYYDDLTYHSNIPNIHFNIGGVSDSYIYENFIDDGFQYPLFYPIYFSEDGYMFTSYNSYYSSSSDDYYDYRLSLNTQYDYLYMSFAYDDDTDHYFSGITSVTLDSFYVSLSDADFSDALYFSVSSFNEYDVIPICTLEIIYSLPGETLKHRLKVDFDNATTIDLSEIGYLIGYDFIYVHELTCYYDSDTYSFKGFEFSLFAPYVSDTDYRSLDFKSYNFADNGNFTSALSGATRFLTTAVGGFMQADFFGFGVTFGGILMVIIVFSITLWFLKVFAGG